MKVNKQEFVSWKRDPVTKKIYEGLKVLRASVEEEMLSDNTIHQEGIGRIRYLSGVREGINQILYLSIEDFDNDAEED
jgi:hypothetical protein